MDYMTMNFNRNGGSGTSDYSQLTNKPSINDVTLSGNKTSADLGLMDHYDIDERPTESSENLIPSGAVWSADKNIKDKLQGSKVVEGNPITVTDAEPMNAESVVVDLEPKQDLHGYDKPWAGGAGKNKCPFDNFLFTSANTWCSLVGEPAANLLDGSPVTLKSGTYYAKLIDFINIDNMQIADSSGDLILNSIGGSFTLASDDTIYIRVRQINTSTTTSSKLQIELGQTATSFAPYSNICPITGYSEVNAECNSDTYTISLDGTKYGGTLDVTEGVLTVDRAEVDLSSLTWEAVSRNRWNAHIDGMRPFESDFVATAISDSFVATTMTQLYNDENYIAFACNDVSDVYVRNGDSVNEPTGQLVYELATPLTIQLTPTQIQMLENTNDISTDGTNIQLKYQPNNVIGECKKYTDEQCAKVLPLLPTTDGTYHLECSVSSGIPTITWVLNS